MKMEYTNVSQCKRRPTPVDKISQLLAYEYKYISYIYMDIYLSNQTSIRNIIQSQINIRSIILGMAFIHNYYQKSTFTVHSYSIFRSGSYLKIKGCINVSDY